MYIFFMNLKHRKSSENLQVNTCFALFLCKIDMQARSTGLECLDPTPYERMSIWGNLTQLASLPSSGPVQRFDVFPLVNMVQAHRHGLWVVKEVRFSLLCFVRYAPEPDGMKCLAMSEIAVFRRAIKARISLLSSLLVSFFFLFELQALL